MSSIVQIKDSAYDGLRSLRVYGNTVQNLWANPSGMMNGVTATANADGSITVSGTATNTAVIQVTSYALKPAGEYTLSIDKSVSSVNGCGVSVEWYKDNTAVSNILLGSGGTLSRTFTIPSDTEYCKLRFRVASGTTVSGTYRVMLNEGSTAQPWCPPGLNSVGELSIVTSGKNLLKFQDNLQPLTRNGITFTPNEDGTITVDGTATYNDTDYYIVGVSWMGRADANFPASDLVFSSNSRAKMYGYDSDGAEVISAIINNGHSQIAAYKAQACAKVIVFLSYSNGQSESNKRVYVQLELGSTATDYEPPGITTTHIDLQGHTLNSLPDGTRDELHIDGGGNVVLEKRTHVLDFDGTEDWYLQSGSSRANLTINDITMAYGGTPSSETNAFSDKLPALAPKQTWSNNNGFAIEPHVFSAFRSGMTGIDDFKSWLQTNNMNAVVGLAEPQTIDLGTIDLLKLRKKPLVNTIWANGTADGTGFSLAPEIDCEYNRWSTYCDGFKTHGKHSYFDMGCCLAARDTGTPEKKSVTATVPYMNGFYDLSKLYGAIAFEARQLMYRFEFVEDSREELQQKKSQFLEWLSQVHDEEIADDDIPGRHFIGSLSEWEFEEGEEGQSGSLEVTFNCQPFLEADEDTTKTCNAGSNTVTVEGQAVNAYAKTNSGTATIQIGGATQSVGTSEIRLSVQLQPGDNAVTVTGSPVVLRWKELTA